MDIYSDEEYNSDPVKRNSKEMNFIEKFKANPSSDPKEMYRMAQECGMDQEAAEDAVWELIGGVNAVKMQEQVHSNKAISRESILHTYSHNFVSLNNAMAREKDVNLKLKMFDRLTSLGEKITRLEGMNRPDKTEVTMTSTFDPSRLPVKDRTILMKLIEAAGGSLDEV